MYVLLCMMVVHNAMYCCCFVHVVLIFVFFEKQTYIQGGGSSISLIFFGLYNVKERMVYCMRKTLDLWVGEKRKFFS